MKKFVKEVFKAMRKMVDNMLAAHGFGGELQKAVFLILLTLRIPICMIYHIIGFLIVWAMSGITAAGLAMAKIGRGIGEIYKALLCNVGFTEYLNTYCKLCFEKEDEDVTMIDVLNDFDALINEFE